MEITNITKDDVIELITKSVNNFKNARENFLYSIFHTLQIYIDAKVLNYTEALNIICEEEIGKISSFIPDVISNLKGFDNFNPDAYTYIDIINEIPEYNEDVAREIFDFACKTKTYGFTIG